MSELYGRSGNAYRVAEVDKGQHLVWTQVFSDDGEPFDGELRIINESALYDSPPPPPPPNHSPGRRGGELQGECRCVSFSVDG